MCPVISLGLISVLLQGAMWSTKMSVIVLIAVCFRSHNVLDQQCMYLDCINIFLFFSLSYSFSFCRTDHKTRTTAAVTARWDGISLLGQ